MNFAAQQKSLVPLVRFSDSSIQVARHKAVAYRSAFLRPRRHLNSEGPSVELDAVCSYVPRDEGD
jgi:hypothetical protein